MKKLSKVTSVVLSIAIVLSCFATLNFAFATIEKQHTVTVTEDFEGEAIDSRLGLEKVNGDVDAFTTEPTVGTEENGNKYYVTGTGTYGWKTNTPGYLAILTPTADFMGTDGKINSVSVDLLPIKTTTYWDAKVIGFYDPTTKAVAGIEFGFNSNQNSFVVRNYIYNMTGSVNSGTAVCAMGTVNGNTRSGGNTMIVAEDTHQIGNWLNIKVSYQNYEDSTGKYVIIKYAIYDKKSDTKLADRTENIKVNTFDGYKAGILSAQENDRAENVVFDNLSIDCTVSKTDAELAADFETANSEIINKDTHEVGLSDLEAYTSAMIDYESLTDGAKDLVADSYAKLVALKSAMNDNIKTAFYNKHQDIIDKDVNNIAYSDKATLFAALEDVSNMSSVEKEATAEYITNLTDKETKFYEVNAKYAGDDFENAYYTNHYMEDVGIATEGYKVENGKFIPAKTSISSDGSVTPGSVTTVKDASWPKTNTIKSLSVDFKVRDNGGKYAQYLYPVYDVREVNGETVTSYVYIETAYSANAGSFVLRGGRSQNVGVITKGTYDKYVNMGNATINIDADSAYTVKADIELVKALNKTTEAMDNIIVVKYTILNESGETCGTRTDNYVWPYDSLNGTKFALPGMETSNVNTFYDNLKVEFNDSAEDYAETASAFETKYADIFDNIVDGKVVDTDEEGFAEKVTAAVIEFDTLSSGFKASTYGVAILEKLNLLKANIYNYDTYVESGVYTQNFEGVNDFKPYSEYSDYSETELGSSTELNKNGVLADDSANTTAYKVKSVIPSGFTSNTAVKYGLFATANKNLWDTMAQNNKYLTSGSFDLYYPELRNLATEITINYKYTDDDNYSFVGLSGGILNNGKCYELASREYTVFDSVNAKSGSNNFKFSQPADYANKWWHFDFMYDENGYFHLVATDENGRMCTFDSTDITYKDSSNNTVKIDRSVAPQNRIVSFGIMGNAYSYLIDNVTFRFSADGVDANANARANFYQKQYSVETLELTPEKVVPYDFARINTFISDFEALGTDNAALMPMVNDKVNEFKARMAKWNTASDETVADSFNSIYGSDTEIVKPVAYSVFNRLTKAQRNLVKSKYADVYSKMINAVKTATADDTVNIACVGDSITRGSGSSDNTTKSYPAQLAEKLGSGYTVGNYGIPGIRVLQDSSVNIHTNGTNGQYRAAGDLGYGGAVCENPDLVIIMLGTNDGVIKNGVFEDVRRNNLKAAYTDLVQGFLALDSNPTVVLATIPVHGSFNSQNPETDMTNFELKRKELDKLYREIADEYGLGVIDIGAFTNEWSVDDRDNLYFANDHLHPNDTGYDKISDFYYNYLTAGKYTNTVNGCIADFTSMSFKTAQPVVSDTIALNYKTAINNALFNAEPNVTPKMQFTIGSDDPITVEGTFVETDSDGNKLYKFELPNILPQQMAENIVAKLIVGDKSESYDNYSVKEYCTKGLNKTAADLGFTADKTAKYHSLLANMLKYGAAAQKYRNVTDETKLATYGVDQALLDKGTASATELANLEDLLALSGDKDDNCYWNSVTLVLKDKVNIRYKFTATDIENLTIKVSIGTTEKEFDKSSFVSTGNANEYYVLFEDIMPYQFGEKVTAQFVENNTAKGQSLNYSVNSYLKRMSANTSINNLLNSINNYGASAKDYVNA